MSAAIVRADGEGEKLWFYGGGTHTWKATAEQTSGSLILFEELLERGKATPLHRHPNEDEVVHVIEGEIRYFADGEEHRVGRGGTIVTPRGVAHAFIGVSDVARLLFLQTPGSGQAFYRSASVPAGDTAGPIDMRKVAEVAQATGTTEVLGPPPFSNG